ncbi:transglutaminase family protein [Roseivivax isoporae]|uniref:Transglutaminase n=1 Tax=Roseivivax isoporae LMG 25204 TaxID=1449351 RepID=X7FB23_9RHOB|nr:transglutaminase family protein [Roseivivax isoporae]ETX30082.1 transglutaminase [Roseivivax isoporae LMG 25204]
MRYDLTLGIAYDYAQPAPLMRNLLRVMPRQIAGVQQVLEARISVLPDPDVMTDRRDFFGNVLTEVVHQRPAKRLEIEVRARVDRTEPAASLDLTPLLDRLPAEIAGQRGLEPHRPHHFLGASPRVEPDAAISDFARDCLPPGEPVLAAVRAVGRALHGHMRFDSGATDVNTAPSEAFAARHGVCQDFTHIMIAALRSLGIPAGYVSGFLRTRPPPGRPRLEGADAMHAWLRAWCGTETGWVEYDPTNDLIVGAEHIAVAVGRDYSDVAPVKGAVRSAGGAATRHTVDLVPLD